MMPATQADQRFEALVAWKAAYKAAHGKDPDIEHVKNALGVYIAHGTMPPVGNGNGAATVKMAEIVPLPVVAELVKTRKPRAARAAPATVEAPKVLTTFDPAAIPFEGEPISFTRIAATGERTDTAALLDDVLAFVKRYIVLPEEHHYVAVALWILHTWGINAFDMTPRLALESPEPQSGKTLVLEVLNVLLNKAIFSLNVSVAALFRVIDDGTRPILFDEVDAIFSQTKGDPGKEDLRGVLNGGYSRGATVLRVKMPGAVLQEFHVFAPVALAAIGKLPATLESRAIIIHMRRRTPDEPVERFRARIVRKTAVPLIERLTEWAPLYEDELRTAEPDIPDEIDDRAQDIWEPLIAIADLAGGDWPERTRRAAVAIHRGRGLDDSSSGVLLLRAIKAAFDKSGVLIGGSLKITTENLMTVINGNDEYPFGGWNNGGGMHSRNLNAMLKPYGVHSLDIKFSGGTRKGFEKVAFADAWSRYTPDLAPSPSATSATDPRLNRNLTSTRKPRKSRISR